ncbi:MAG: GGDEF domain-containing protein [Atribacterota bacterium]
MDLVQFYTPWRKLGKLRRYSFLLVILVFLPGYLLVSKLERWYLTFFAFGALVVGTWIEGKIGFSLSSLVWMFLLVAFIGGSGWYESPFLFLLLLSPAMSLLGEKFREAFWMCGASTIFLAILGVWALWRENVFWGWYILGLVASTWFFFLLFRERQGSMVRRLLHLEKLADRDPLTGLGNRRALQRVVSTLVGEGTPFVLSIVDLDCFKECNDFYGHEKGDEVLQQFGTILRFSVRQSDFVFRYGGDEFIILFLGVAPEAVAEVLQRIEKRLEESFPKVGMSWGIASFPEEARDRTQIFRLADERLYALKRERKEARFTE